MQKMTSVATKLSTLFLIIGPTPRGVSYEEGFHNDAHTISIVLSQYVSPFITPLQFHTNKCPPPPKKKKN